MKILKTQEIINEVQKINVIARNNLKKHCHDNHVMHKHFYEKAGISMVLFSKWINGHKDMAMKTLMKLEEIYPELFQENNN